MSTKWMKQALIASVLTVLMTLPATAQQRRLSGPAKPAAGTPGKLEVPKELLPEVQKAVQATQQLLKAKLEVLNALKALKLKVIKLGNSEVSQMKGSKNSRVGRAHRSAKDHKRKDPRSDAKKDIKPETHSVAAVPGNAGNLLDISDRIEEGIIATATENLYAMPQSFRSSKAHRKGADSIVDANTGVTDAWIDVLSIDLKKEADRISGIDASIVKVQKAIQSPPISMVGNKLNFSMAER